MMHTDDIDGRVCRLLEEALPVPDHEDGYRERLVALVEVESQGRARAVRRPVWRRPRWLAVAAATAAAATVLATWVGIPGIADRTGPEPVSAAAIVAIAQRALGSGHTLEADLVSVYRDAYPEGEGGEPVPGGEVVTRSHIMLRDDGSVRQTQFPRTLAEAVRLAHTPLPGGQGNSYMGTWALRDDRAYDAASATFRWYGRGYDAMYPPGRRLATQAVLLTGCAPGDPDWGTGTMPGTMPLASFGDVRQDLAAVADGAVRESTFDGRPVWVVTSRRVPAHWGRYGSGTSRDPYAWGPVGPQVDRITVVVDRATGLPLRTQTFLRGVLLTETRLENVRVDRALPADAFTFAFPQGSRVLHQNMGFRSATSAQAASRTGYPPLSPAWLPAGYVLQTIATAPRDGSWRWGDPVHGTDVVTLRYGRGFDALSISTRRVVNGARVAATDPFGGDPTEPGSPNAPVAAPITAGSLAGTTAHVVAGPNTSPHLWAVKDGLLVTIAGPATATELLAIAGSLRAFGAP